VAAAQEHPAAEAWTPEPPPPPQRRIGPGLVASLIALLLVFGMIGLVAARRAGVAHFGAGSPEAAASGLLAALDRDPLDAQALDRASRYLTGEERLLAGTYGDRIAKRAARPSGPDTLGIVGFGARDVRFQRVGGSGGSDGVTVLEAVSGTVHVRTGGGRLELSVDEARRRLAEQTSSRVTSLRVVTLRTGGRWYVALLPTALEWTRLDGGGPADYAKLTAAASPGVSSPEAAVSGLLSGLRQQRPLDEILAGAAPSERNAFEAYLAALQSSRGWAGAGGAGNEMLGLPAPYSAGGPVTGTEQVADRVVKVYFKAERSSGGPEPDAATGPPTPYVIAVQRDGTWYPSIVFTLTDLALTTSAEQEHS
jgi:hypothetical protein